MNRLWVRFTLVIIGILLAVIILPIFLGPLLFSSSSESPTFDPEITAYIETIPDDIQEKFKQQVIGFVQAFAIRTALIVAAAAMIAGIVLSRMLSAPLQDLAAGARAIAEGNLTYRVPARGSDEMRTVAESFNEMAGRLEQAETLRRNLLTDVAHELRNPLHVLRGSLQAILEGVYPLNEEELSRLMGQTEHLTRLVNDLHELAQAEARQLPLHRQTIDPGNLVKEVAAAFRSLAVAQGVDLRVELLGAPPLIPVDPDRIRQATQNLLANALRYTPANGQILVTVTERDGWAEIAVSDNGSGIDAEHLPLVFDRFFRTDSARDRESGGAGLGLAIVKAIAEAHGGDARAESAGPGKGSTFIIRLPLDPDERGIERG